MPDVTDPSADPIGSMLAAPLGRQTAPREDVDPIGAMLHAPDVGQLVPSETPGVVGQSAKHYLTRQLAGQRTWADVAGDLSKAGIDPERHRQDYQLAEARAVQGQEGVGVIESFKRNSLPFGDVFDVKGTKEYDAAKKRFEAGKATGGDAGTIARYERLQQIDQQVGSTFEGKLVQGLASVPKIGGENLAAGKLVGGLGRVAGVGMPAAPTVAQQALGFAGRQAVATPLMPSLYLDQARQANMAAGREPDDLRGFPTPLAMGFANNLVLGHLQGKLGGSVPTLAGRSLVKGAVGAGEAQAVEVAGGIADHWLPEQYKTHTGYGALGKLASDPGHALSDYAASALTFSVFAGLHDHGPTARGQERAQAVTDKAAKAADQLAEAGIPPAAAAEVARQVVTAPIEAVARGQMTKAEALANLDNAPAGLADYARAVLESVDVAPQKPAPPEAPQTAPARPVGPQLLIGRGKPKGIDQALQWAEGREGQPAKPAAQPPTPSEKPTPPPTIAGPESHLRNLSDDQIKELGGGIGMNVKQMKAAATQPWMKPLVDSYLGLVPSEAPRTPSERPGAEPVRPAAEARDRAPAEEPAPQAAPRRVSETELADRLKAGDVKDVSRQVRGEVESHLAAGGRVVAHIDGKPVEITSVAGGSMKDAQGQSWGLLPMAGTAPGKRGGIDFLPAEAKPTVAGEHEPAGAVRDAVRAAFGEHATHLGEGEYSVDVGGDRFIAITKGAEPGRVQLNFDYVEAQKGSERAPAGPGIQRGTMQVMNAIRKVVSELGRRGVGIEYTASGTRGAGGRTSRAELYERVLRDAGFERKGAITTRSGMVEAWWDAPAKVSSSAPPAAPSAPGVSDKVRQPVGPAALIERMRAGSKPMEAKAPPSLREPGPAEAPQSPAEQKAEAAAEQDRVFQEQMRAAIRAEKQERGEPKKNQTAAGVEAELKSAQKEYDDALAISDAEVLALHRAVLARNRAAAEAEFGRPEREVPQGAGAPGPAAEHPRAGHAPPAEPGPAGADAGVPHRRLRGAETTIAVPGEAAVPARYEVRELADLVPSHDAVPPRNFTSNVKAGKYPTELQPRDYETDTGEQNKVWDGGRAMETRYFLSNHPSATQGPPTVTKNNRVINGNGRAMMIQASTHLGTYGKYRTALEAEAERFGVDPAQVRGMKEPVLVRVVNMDPGGPEARKFAAAGNVGETQAQSPAREAASYSRLVDDRLLSSLKLTGDATFSKLVSDPAGGRAFRQKLFDALPAAARGRFFEAGDDVLLTDAGKELVRNLLLSKLGVPVKTVEELGRERASLLNGLEAAAPQLLKLSREKSDLDVTPALLQAVEILRADPDLKTKADVQDAFDQLDMFTGERRLTTDPATRMMVDFLIDSYGENGQFKARQFRDRLVKLSTGARAGDNLFGGEEPGSAGESVAEALGVPYRKGATFGPEAPATVAGKKPAGWNTTWITPGETGKGSKWEPISVHETMEEAEAAAGPDGAIMSRPGPKTIGNEPEKTHYMGYGVAVHEWVAFKAKNAAGGEALGKDQFPLPPGDVVHTTERGGIPVRPGDGFPRGVGIEERPREPRRDFALAKAKVDEQRAEENPRRPLGQPAEKIGAAARKSNPTAWDEATRLQTADPGTADRLVAELLAKPRPMNSTEGAVLLQRRIALSNTAERLGLNLRPTDADLARERAVWEGIDRLDQAVRKAGTELGRGLQFFRQLALEDYTLAGMLGRARREKGEELTDAERERVKDHHAEVEAADKAVADAESGTKPAAAEGQPGDMTSLLVNAMRARRRFTQTVTVLSAARLSGGRRLLGNVIQTFNAARAIQTAFDLSYALRQGAILTAAHPFKAARAFRDSLRAFASEDAADRADFLVKHRPNALSGLYERAGLYLADRNVLSAQEEAFMNNILGRAERVPVIGLLAKGVKASERAYTTFLNSMRADVFDQLAGDLAKTGIPTDAEAKATANFINVATGRGHLGRFEDAATGLAQVFFSPRFMVSRFQLLAGQPFYQGSARTRLMVAREFGKALGALGLFYAVASLDDKMKLSFDPRSTDFGKLRWGNTRVDPLAGLAQTAVFVTRITAGETKTGAGKVEALRGAKVPYGGSTVPDVILRFIRGKLAPVPAGVMDRLAGRTTGGESVTTPAQAGQLVTPMAVRDVYETLKDQGVPRGSALSLLAILGMGAQTYEAKAPRPEAKPLADRLKALVGAR